MSEDSRLLGKLIESWQLKSRKAFLIHLLIRKLIQNQPDDSLLRKMRGDVSLL